MQQYLVVVAVIVVIIIVLRFILNRPSKLKKEHEARMKEIKEKYKGKYDEVRPLEKDKKKYY